MRLHGGVLAVLLSGALLAGCGSLQVGVETATRAAVVHTATQTAPAVLGTPTPAAGAAAGTPGAASASTVAAPTASATTSAPAGSTALPSVTSPAGLPAPTVGPANTVAPGLTTAPSPTAPPSPTSAPGPTGSPTESPSGTPAAGAVFSADTTQFTPGMQVNLHWQAPTNETGAVSISLLAAQGARPGLQTWRDLPASGSLSVKLDVDPRGPYEFELAPQGGEWPVQTIPVRFPCPASFFFAPPGATWPRQVPTDPQSCPESAPSYSTAFEQDFEGGRMIWLGAGNPILVLFGDGVSTSGAHDWAAYSDTWQAGEAESDPALTPPEGRFQPVKGAGKLWRSVPEVRNRLGWALAEAQSYITPDQRDWAYPGADVPTYRYLLSASNTLLVLTDYTGHGRSPFWFDVGP